MSSSSVPFTAIPSATPRDESPVSKPGYVPYRPHRCQSPALFPIVIVWLFVSAAMVSSLPASMRCFVSRTGSGEFGLYLRDIILGINDGTVSMFNLLVGVTGGNSCQKEVGPCVLQRCNGIALRTCQLRLLFRSCSLASRALLLGPSAWLCPNL